MDYMKQALALAKLAVGQVSPNPAVGAVIVKEGEVVGQGYTQPPGSWHAEVMALKQAGEKARGGTMYVSLEPCCHYGRTPPCTKAIIAAGISEVHMAMIDPNPVVAGRGEEELSREGIKTYIGECEEEARIVNEAYIKFITTGIPFVTAKFAMSLDGKIATRIGDSQWITGVEARKYVHYLRYTADAIMAGANTILTDNPYLTSRYGEEGGTVRKRPLRIIVDGGGRTPASAHAFTEPGKSLLVVSRPVSTEKQAALSQTGTQIVELPSAEGQVDLAGLLKRLGECPVTSVLVEGGGILLGSLFDAGLVDKVVVFIAPIVIGGEKARIAVAGRGVERVMDAIKLERVSVEKFGDDLMVTGYVRKR